MLKITVGEDGAGEALTSYCGTLLNMDLCDGGGLKPEGQEVPEARTQVRVRGGDFPVERSTARAGEHYAAVGAVGAKVVVEDELPGVWRGSRYLRIHVMR